MVTSLARFTLALAVVTATGCTRDSSAVSDPAASVAPVNPAPAPAPPTPTPTPTNAAWPPAGVKPNSTDAEGGAQAWFAALEIKNLDAVVSSSAFPVYADLDWSAETICAWTDATAMRHCFDQRSAKGAAFAYGLPNVPQTGEAPIHAKVVSAATAKTRIAGRPRPLPGQERIAGDKTRIEQLANIAVFVDVQLDGVEGPARFVVAVTNGANGTGVTAAWHYDSTVHDSGD